MVKLKILTGSTRPGRFNIQPSKWIYEIAAQYEGAEAELLDLEVINLPFLDEPNLPARHQYAEEHTKSWSAKIDEADGLIFVTPEYNHSYSAVLKNAIDYLFTEWNFKPVGFVSYGGLLGGALAVEHLRTVTGALKMYDLREQILLTNYWNDLDENGDFKFDEHHVQAANAMLKSLVFWAEEMKSARTEML